MSDTPRTDAEYDNALEFEFDSEDRLQDMRRFSKKLERELNAANQIIQQQQLLQEENLRLTDKIHQLYAGAEEQKQTIKELEEVNEYLRQKNDKLEYGRTSK